MSKAIKDEFMGLPLSKQRKYQLRMKRDGRCVMCGEAAVGGVFCLNHMVENRERERRRGGLKRRWKGALSYKLEDLKSTSGGISRSDQDRVRGTAFSSPGVFVDAGVESLI
jgi:hypothetical protein